LAATYSLNRPPVPDLNAAGDASSDDALGEGVGARLGGARNSDRSSGQLSGTPEKKQIRRAVILNTYLTLFQGCQIFLSPTYRNRKKYTK
jgi:hypothetical protein